MIRLYGHLQGSFRMVSEGLKVGLEELGLLDGYHIGEALDFDTEPVPGATAPIAIVVGDPMRVLLAHTQGDHEQIWLMLAPNSEGIPPHLRQQLRAQAPGSTRSLVTGFLAPSGWAVKVIRREFLSYPVKLCPHGVLPVFQPGPHPSQDADILHAVHLTSSGLSRKCTRELIEIWASLRQEIGADLRLFIYANPMFAPQIAAYVQDKRAAAFIEVVNGQNLPPAALAQVYRSAHVVVQPSRAEGFGLVPLEARACGTPVVMTEVTGHREHLRALNGKGVVVVPHGPLVPSDDYWGATAPQVLAKDIQVAMVTWYKNRKQLAADAQEVAEDICTQWTWAAGLKTARWKKTHA